MSEPNYLRDIVAFCRDMYPVEGAYGPDMVVLPFMEEWLRRAFPLPKGDPAARNILDSRSKKQGKSTIAGVVAVYMAARKPYSEVVIAAADKDQAKDRVLRSVKYAIENGPLWRHAKVYREFIELDNRSTIQVLPYDWRGAAGGNYSAVIFDELHTYTLELQRRMYDELIIPPTVEAGVRWIASYAGHRGESVLLRDIWDMGKAGRREPGELPIYFNPTASLLALIDQGETSWRMPWITPEYIAEIRASERPNTFRRLWLNEWVSSESRYVTREQWARCYSQDVRPLTIGDDRRAVFGVDASTSRDLTALVGVVRDPRTELSEVVYCRTWKPQPDSRRDGKPTVDLEAGLGEEVLRLNRAGQLSTLYADNYQLHTLILKWRREGIGVVELPQTAARTEADQALYDAIIGRTLVHYGDPVLDEHISNAVAVESPRGFRLAKHKTTQKIDAAVALSMALYGALSQRESNYIQWVKDYLERKHERKDPDIESLKQRMSEALMKEQQHHFD